MLLVDRKSVWVTGASGKLGSEVCKAFSSMGMKVVAHGFHKRPTHRPFVQGDLSDSNEAARLYGEVRQTIGIPDVLVCCAGGVASQGDTSFSITKDLFAKTFRTNYLTAVNCCSLVAPEMLKRERGNIVLVGSNIVGNPRHWSQFACYATAKAALHEYAAQLAKGVEGSGVRVVCVAPDTIRPDLVPCQRVVEAITTNCRPGEFLLCRLEASC